MLALSNHFFSLPTDVLLQFPSRPISVYPPLHLKLTLNVFVNRSSLRWHSSSSTTCFRSSIHLTTRSEVPALRPLPLLSYVTLLPRASCPSTSNKNRITSSKMLPTFSFNTDTYESPFPASTFCFRTTRLVLLLLMVVHPFSSRSSLHHTPYHLPFPPGFRLPSSQTCLPAAY